MLDDAVEEGARAAEVRHRCRVVYEVPESGNCDYGRSRSTVGQDRDTDRVDVPVVSTDTLRYGLPDKQLDPRLVAATSCARLALNNLKEEPDKGSVLTMILISNTNFWKGLIVVLKICTFRIRLICINLGEVPILSFSRAPSATIRRCGR